MSKVWTAALGRLVLVEGDPGTNQIANPFDGLEPGDTHEIEAILENKSLSAAKINQSLIMRDLPIRLKAHTQGIDQEKKTIRNSAKNAARDIKRISDETNKNIAPILSALMSSKKTLKSAQEESSRLWANAYSEMFDIGRDASGLRDLGGDVQLLREEETWFRSAVREELGYWNKFLEQVSEGKVATARVWERFGDYVKALRFMFEASRAQAIPDNALLYWMGPRDDNRCRGCVYLQEKSPFPKHLLPSVPRDGKTNCGVHCRHRIVVRIARSQAMVESRSRALPSRDVMAQELARLKTWKSNKAKPGGKAQNPFLGEPIDVPTQAQARAGLALDVVGRGMRITGRGDKGEVQYNTVKSMRFGESACCESEINLPLRVVRASFGRPVTVVGTEVRIGPSFDKRDTREREEMLLRVVGGWLLSGALGRHPEPVELHDFIEYMTNWDDFHAREKQRCEYMSRLVRGRESRIRAWIAAAMEGRHAGADVDKKPNIDKELERAGFKSAKQAKAALKALSDIKKLKKLSPEVLRAVKSDRKGKYGSGLVFEDA